MSEPREDDDERMPSTDELQEPSTEKDPGEEPKDPGSGNRGEPGADADAPADGEDDADHLAVGIGIPPSDAPPQ